MKRTTAKTKKKNPGIADLAAAANTILTTMQIHDHMTKRTKKRKSTRRRNPETQTQINARMAKVRAARKMKANPAKKAASSVSYYLNPFIDGVYLSHGTTLGKRFATQAAAREYARKHGLKLRNPVKPKAASAPKVNGRKKVSVPAKGRFYLMAVGQGDDTLGVFINDRDGDGITKKFKSVAAAKAYATRNKLRLENPAEVQVIKPTPTLRKQLKANPDVVPNGFFSRYRAKRRAKREYGRELAYAAKIKRSRAKRKKAEALAWNPAPKRVSVARTKVAATPTAAKRNGAKKTATVKANPSISKSCTSLKQAERYQNSLYNKYDHVRLVRFPMFSERGTYTWEVKDPIKRNPKPKTKAQRPKANPPKAPRSRLFENFQGRTTSTTKRLETSQHLGSQRLIQLGKLHEIKLVGERPFKLNPSRAVLCATQTGKLAIAGQRFAKRNPGMRSNEISLLGEIEHVVYETYKPHHGDSPGQRYIHELGEDTGQRPKLYADNAGFPLIRGGAYSVRPEGIVN